MPREKIKMMDDDKENHILLYKKKAGIHTSEETEEGAMEVFPSGSSWVQATFMSYLGQSNHPHFALMFQKVLSFLFFL